MTFMVDEAFWVNYKQHVSAKSSRLFDLYYCYWPIQWFPDFNNGRSLAGIRALVEQMTFLTGQHAGRQTYMISSLPTRAQY